MNSPESKLGQNRLSALSAKPAGPAACPGRAQAYAPHAPVARPAHPPACQPGRLPTFRAPARRAPRPTPCRARLRLTPNCLAPWSLHNLGIAPTFFFSFPFFLFSFPVAGKLQKTYTYFFSHFPEYSNKFIKIYFLHFSSIFHLVKSKNIIFFTS